MLTLHCDHSTHLVSNDFCDHGDLSRAERWAVRLHELCCRSCRRFRQQVEFMTRAAKTLAHRELTNSEQLSDESMRRIKSAIERNLS
jgi:hypothetical protein